MTNTFKTALRMSAVAALATTALSTTAYAEYRCATPEGLAAWEKKACELARHDTSDDLIHYVNRTKPIYNMYVNDYVGKADVERWELVKRTGAEGIAKAKSDIRGVSKTD